MIIPNAPAVAEMSEGGSTVPEATYDYRVHKAEYIDTPKSKDAKGPYIKCQHVITGPGDGRHVGRMVFQNYSVTGDGSFRLRELLTVTGHPADFRLTDTEQLVGLEFSGATTVRKGTNGYSDQNEIKRHFPFGQGPISSM